MRDAVPVAWLEQPADHVGIVPIRPYSRLGEVIGEEFVGPKDGRRGRRGCLLPSSSGAAPQAMDKDDTATPTLARRTRGTDPPGGPRLPRRTYLARNGPSFGAPLPLSNVKPIRWTSASPSLMVAIVAFVLGRLSWKISRPLLLCTQLRNGHSPTTGAPTTTRLSRTGHITHTPPLPPPLITYRASCLSTVIGEASHPGLVRGSRLSLDQ